MMSIKIHINKVYLMILRGVMKSITHIKHVDILSQKFKYITTDIFTVKNTLFIVKLFLLLEFIKIKFRKKK